MACRWGPSRPPATRRPPSRALGLKIPWVLAFTEAASLPGAVLGPRLASWFLLANLFPPGGRVVRIETIWDRGGGFQAVLWTTHHTPSGSCRARVLYSAASRYLKGHPTGRAWTGGREFQCVVPPRSSCTPPLSATDCDPYSRSHARTVASSAVNSPRFHRFIMSSIRMETMRPSYSHTPAPHRPSIALRRDVHNAAASPLFDPFITPGRGLLLCNTIGMQHHRDATLSAQHT